MRPSFIIFVAIAEILLYIILAPHLNRSVYIVFQFPFNHQEFAQDYSITQSRGRATMKNVEGNMNYGKLYTNRRKATISVHYMIHFCGIFYCMARHLQILSVMYSKLPSSLKYQINSIQCNTTKLTKIRKNHHQIQVSLSW